MSDKESKRTELERQNSLMSNNAEVMPDAGKIVMDKGELWGTGIVREFRETVIGHCKLSIAFAFVDRHPTTRKQYPHMLLVCYMILQGGRK